MPWQKRLSTLIEDDLKDRAELAMRKVIVDTLSKVVLRTPVDTGRARGNWSAGVNSASTGGSEDPSGGTTISNGAASVNGASLGDTVYISNGLPYIERLENGWSQQAPAGMVGLSLAEIPSRIEL